MAARHNLIVVSNSGPVTYGRSGGERTARRGGGGLVTALRSLVLHHDVTWIASAMSEEDRVVANENDGEAFEETARDGTSFRLRLVAHDEHAYDWYYNVVANPMLWFLQHHLWGLAFEPVIDHGFHHAWSEGYVAVNQAFADAVLDELDRDPSAAVFFHDYHLYVAPRIVRDARPETRLVHFVHIPWPGTDSWSVLPLEIRRAIHDGLLANDVVGFHTRRWRRNFMRVAEDTVGAVPDWARDVLGYDGRRVVVTAAPISVDTAEFDDLAQSPAVIEAGERLARAAAGEADPARRPHRSVEEHRARLSRARALPRRAPGDARPRRPARAPRPVAAGDSRSTPSTSARSSARRGASTTGSSATAGCRSTSRSSDNFPQAVAAYKDFDVLLVNAIFDGLNLIAKEAPLVNERDGVLILSENAGAHEELGDWALSVNPFDVAGQADAIHRALEMPADERRQRLGAIRSWVREHDLAAWIELQLQALDAEELQSPV